MWSWTINLRSQDSLPTKYFINRLRLNTIRECYRIEDCDLDFKGKKSHSLLNVRKIESRFFQSKTAICKHLRVYNLIKVKSLKKVLAQQQENQRKLTKSYYKQTYNCKMSSMSSLKTKKFRIYPLKLIWSMQVCKKYDGIYIIM